EVALQLGVQRDQAFVKGELEMMLAFLMAADEERDEHKVVKTWVKQVRDVAYDVEDSLQDFAVRLGKPPWWRFLRTLIDRHRVAKQMKDLRAKVEDPATITAGHSSMAGATTFDAEEEMRQKRKAKVDLLQLIDSSKDKDLKVIAVCGTNDDVLRQIPIIIRAYYELKRSKKFECYAWIRVTHPFNPSEFLKCIMWEFYVSALEEAETSQEKVAPGAQVLKKMGIMKQDDLVHDFSEYVNKKRYLIVINELSTIEEWNSIKTFFPNSKKGCRIIVSTQQSVAASLCLGKEMMELELKQSSVGQNVYAFCNKTMMETAFRESQLVGRSIDKQELLKLILNKGSQQLELISICGMGGLGKTTLVKYVYQSQELFANFDKRACVTIKRPFDRDDLLNSLAMQLNDKEPADGNRTKKGVGSSLSSILEGKKYLIVLDDVSSTREWDDIKQQFPPTKRSRIILNILKHDDAHDLFTKKVFGETIDLCKQYPELVDEEESILKKCDGLPLAIVTIGGFLAKQQKTPMEWRKLNEHISAELEMNPELGLIKNILIKSYDGLPYHLKSCFLYLSTFPEDYTISRRHLVQRWIAEGYSSEVRGKSQGEIADSYFMDLIDRSMILPSRKLLGTRKGVESCQVHDLMREISISKSTDENLVFRLEEGYISNTQDKVRHVAVSSNWEGDKSEFESAVDLAHIRSLTVFAEWRPFFISEKMKLLRVLDLEGTSGLVDHHLEHIGRLVHLKYVSLRGCDDIYHLPDSWGKLRQLQTLDIKGTRICKLPKAITKLTKLQYLFGGERNPWCVYRNDRVPEDLPKLCGACCAPQHLKDVERMTGDPNRHDVCSFWCHVVFPTLASRRLDPYGVVVPKGIRKLKSLRTLGVISIAGGSGKAMLRDIRKLTQLRKLAVRGIKLENCKELCSTLADLSRVESLSLTSSGGKSGLLGCLDSLSTPPRNLQSLKLYWELVKLPEWIGGLQSLVKLVLRGTKLTEVDDTIQVLGKLPNLAILRLRGKSLLMGGEHRRLSFHRGALPSLMVLQLNFIVGLDSVLCFAAYSPIDAKDRMFSGLTYLPRLKEFILDNDPGYKEGFLNDLQQQLAGNQNGPVLKRCSVWELR
ncbi:hypothetical protein BS78_07G209400, partial [Paspalum vaginatum]